MTATVKKIKTSLKPARGAGFSTTVFIPEDVHMRLAQYIMERFHGRNHMRNKVILEALVEKLEKERF